MLCRGKLFWIPWNEKLEMSRAWFYSEGKFCTGVMTVVRADKEPCDPRAIQRQRVKLLLITKG